MINYVCLPGLQQNEQKNKSKNFADPNPD